MCSLSTNQKHYIAFQAKVKVSGLRPGFYTTGDAVTDL